MNEAQRVAQQAAICYPSSPTVWMSLLQCESAVIEGKEEVKEERMNRLCSEAIEKVPSKVKKNENWVNWYLCVFVVCRFLSHYGSTG